MSSARPSSWRRARRSTTRTATAAIRTTAGSSSLFPDLRYAGPIHGAEAFKAIVIDGALEPNGMVSFRKVLKPDDAEAIRAYVVHLANELKKNPPPAAPFGFGPAARGRRRGRAGRATSQPAGASAVPRRCRRIAASRRARRLPIQ